MGVSTEENKLLIIREPKTVHFDWPKDVGHSLKHEIDSVIKHNCFLAEDAIKETILADYFPI